MARIGNITFELPGRTGQTMEDTLEQILEDLRRQLGKTLGQTAATFGRLGKDAQSGIGSVAKMLQNLANGTLKKASGTYRRSLMEFDQLNRLTKNSGTASYVARNNELIQSLDTLLGKLATAGQVVNEKVLDPVITWGKNKVMDTVNRIKSAFAGVLGQPSNELQNYTGMWDRLNEKTKTWRELMGQTQGTVDGVNRSMEQGSTDAQQLSGDMLLLGRDSVDAMNSVLGIGTAAHGSWDATTGTWGNSDPWFTKNVTSPLLEKFTGLWDEVPNQADDSWKETKTVFSDTGNFFERTFSDAWSKVGKVFSKDGQVSTQIESGVVRTLKTAVNGIIGAVNKVVCEPFEGLNNVLAKLQSTKVAGMRPFASLSWRATVPKIPYLAQGAVLPANKPFLAMVGDQRHGTNVEAPLATIQEALALVMEDYTQANMAGHGATVEVLRQILQAVLGVQIGDEVIAAAYDRYQSKIAVINGR